MNIKFTKPFYSGKELEYLKDVIENEKDITGDGEYTQKVHNYFENKYGVARALMTTSATTALEFAVRLLDLQQDDEILVPSFTFSSTVNAILVNFVKPVFVDVTEDTLNIDPQDIERKITSKTKAIMVVHYAGVACDMDKIMKIAKKYNLKVIEDAAQCIEAKHKNKYLGTIGDFGCLSFHGTKNVVAGEGGLLLINTKDEKVIRRAEIIREKGTNRTEFMLGQVDKYTWVDIGSSILPSDLLSALLYAQLENVDRNIKRRLAIYNKYAGSLTEYAKEGQIKLPTLPAYSVHNAHIFYILLQDNKSRNFLLKFLKDKGIGATFHYVPLHSSPYGKKMGYKAEDLPITESIAGRLLRLPLHAGMTAEEVQFVIKMTKKGLDEIKQIKIDQIPTLSIGIPAYNEVNNIKNVIQDVIAQNQIAYKLDEIIIVTDGCEDGTNRVVEKLAKKYPFIKMYHDGRRMGKASRLNQIYQLNKSKLLLTLDADVKLATSDEINKIVKALGKGVVVGGNLVPIKPKGFAKTLYYQNYALWNEMRQDLNSGDHIANLYGSATLVDGAFAKTVVYPANITADEEYLYFSAKKVNGFRFAKNTCFYFKPVQSFREYLIHGRRVLNERNYIVDYFGPESLKAHHIPTKTKIKELVKLGLFNPVVCFGVVVLNIIIRIAPQNDALNKEGMWQTLTTTKIISPR